MSLNSTPRTFVTGEIETAAIFNAEVRDALTGIQAAATAYTPTITNMTLGNGSTVFRYMRVGKWVTLWFRLVAGSTTTYTASAVAFSLPVNHRDGTETIGAAKMYTGSANMLGAVDVTSASTFTVYVPANTTTVALAGIGFSSGSCNPGTAGNLNGTLIYEAA